MGGSLSLFGNLAEKVALLISLVFVYGLISPRLKRVPPRLRGLVMGALFGAIGIVNMLDPGEVAPGVVIDGRVIIVALAGVFGGFETGGTAGLLVGAYRFWLGGAGMRAGLGAIVTAAALGAWVNWQWGARVREFRSLHFLLLGGGLVASGLLWTLALPDPDLSRRLVALYVVPVGVLYPLATLLAGLLLSYVHGEREQAMLTEFSIEHSQDAVLWVDRGGRLRRVNAATRRLLGYSPQELASLCVWDVHVNFSEQLWHDVWEDARERGSLVLETAFRGKDGSQIPVEFSANFFEFEGVPCVCIIARDISARTRAAEEAARLQVETERRRQAAERLAEAGRLLSRTLATEEVAERILESIRALIQTRASAFYRLSAETGDLVTVAVSGEAGPEFGVPIVLSKGTGAIGLAVRDGRPVVTPNFLTDPRLTFTPEMRAQLERAPFRSVLAVPLIVRGEVIGALGVGDRESRVFGKEEIELAQAFADQAAVALENARLYAEAEQHRRSAEMLADVERLISQSLDPAEVAQEVVEAVHALLEAESSALLRLHPEAGEFRILAVSGELERRFGRDAVFPADTGAAGAAVRDQRPVVSPDVLSDPRIHYTSEVRALSEGALCRAVLAVPLVVRERVIGALSVARPTGRTFEADEIRLAEGLADQAAIALENSRLYEELQQALEQLAASHRQIVEVERLRALGELAGGVAHTFNNALAIILGRIELLLTRARSPNVQRQLRVIEATAKDAARTVKRIEEFTRMRQSRSFEPVDLNQVVDEVVELTRSRWKEEAHARGIAYDVVMEPGSLPPAAGDPSELREVMTNLLFNALDAMPAGGRVTFRTGVAGNEVFCAVTDTGIGMTDEVRQRVFDPFFTTKGERGSGLGLSVVYGIISRHGGTVDAESQVGQGTTFTIRLPLGRDLPGISKKVPPPAPQRRGRILIIDDEPELLEILGELLTGQGHAVTACSDGESGVRRFLEKPFDLVITDLGMPGMSGWQVVEQVKRQSPGTPVALLTGWGDHLAPEETRSKGADFLISKPFTSEAIEDLLAHALASRR